MSKRTIPSSELIINDDGTVFHLHLKPGQIADTVILVGDPARVELIASRFDERECRAANREFITVTGRYRGKRMSVLSTGIGVGNIDISVTELDALANVDFGTRTVKECLHRLTLVRLGTSGALQPDIELGDVVFSRTSVGFDGLLNYYRGRNDVCDLDIERAFMEHTGWSDLLPKPYFVDASPELRDLFADTTTEGITIAAPGFYAPQGRWVRLQPADGDLKRQDRVVPLRRPPYHQFRDGGVGIGRACRTDGAPCRHVVHHYCTAGVARCRYRLPPICRAYDRHGARQAGFGSRR